MKRITRSTLFLMFPMSLVFLYHTYLTERITTMQPTTNLSDSLVSMEIGPQPWVLDTLVIPDTGPSRTASTKRYRLKYGQSFHDILVNQGVTRTVVNRSTSQLRKLINPRELNVGLPYEVQFDNDRQPFKLICEIDVLHPIEIDLQSGNVYMVNRKADVKIRTLDLPISFSLAATLAQSNAPDDLIDKVLSIFAWKIDFDQLQNGDQLMMTYEETSFEGRIMGSGRILAAHFIHEGNLFQAYSFDNGHGNEYFDEMGHNMSHAPLQFDLITSLYEERRFHPVRRTYRSHRGMDFEAEIGTPIEAMDSGQVVEARYGKANGNFVKIRHSAELMTQYLHLSKIDSNITVGKTVLRGQVIGEVGSTGLSSGPHLCLRVWLNDSQIDPLTYNFPRREDVTPQNQEAFLKLTKAYSQKLELTP